MFLERRAVIQALYDNLKDKSTVLASKAVLKVISTVDRIQIETTDGCLFTGDVLIGADGIYSTVRHEMWRLADEQSIDHISVIERDNVPTTYCCIYGISNYECGFPKFETQHVQGQGHSYLLSTGPNSDVYWFLFKQLPAPIRGLRDRVPQYTAADRDALAKEHAGDQLTEALCFGDLYRTGRTATLQALPEVVFSKWHEGRIMTIGDAAHKVNDPACDFMCQC